MGIRCIGLALAIVLGSWSIAHAQADEAPATPTPAAAATSDASGESAEPSVESSVEATLEEASEPMPETPPGYEAPTVPTPPRRTGPAPRRTVVAQAHDDELPSSTPAPAASDPSVELALTVNGLLSFSSTTTPVLVTNADLVFALDGRAWIGLGIAFSYSEQHTMGGFGVPDMKFVTSSISVPLILQYYFDTPHVGAAVPTLRVQLTPGWSETPVGSPTPSTQVVTGSVTLLGGVTWMAASWFALRIIGGVNGGFGVNVVGPVNILGNAGVQALVSAVVRF